MTKALSSSLFLILAAAVAACGDDSSGTGGGGGESSTTATGTTTGGTTTSATTSGTTTGNGTTTSSGSGGEGGAGTGGAGTGGEGTGGTPGEGGFSAGDPIEVTPETWTWVDFPESRCINDTPTGIGVNFSGSNDEDIVIFLQGGNACFNQTSCFVTANTDGYGAGKFENDPTQDADLFQREKGNPLGDWSYVYVPYCTGDVHAGHRNGVEVGGATRNFHGYYNLTRFLERVVPSFPNARRVLLTGVSAGGFGAAYNYEQVKRAFGDDVRVYLLDDSGPPMAAEFVSPCLQRHFRDTWGLDGTLPEDCVDCFAGDTFTEEFLTYIVDTYPGERFGLISSEQDSTIRQFWGYGTNDCADLNDAIPPSYPGSLYTDGLIDIRDRVANVDNFALFMPPGTRHVWVNNESGLSTTVDGSPTLLDWIVQEVEDDEAWQSWPAN